MPCFLDIAARQTGCVLLVPRGKSHLESVVCIVFAAVYASRLSIVRGALR